MLNRSVDRCDKPAARGRATIIRMFMGHRHLRTAQRAWEGGRLDVAEDALSRGLRLLPNDPDLLILGAIVARGMRRDEVFRERSRMAFDAAPERPACIVGLASSLRLDGEYEAAKALLQDGLSEHPDDRTILAETGRLANARRDFPAALAIWERLCLVPSPNADWFRHRAEALIMLHRLDEAEVLIGAGFPRDAGETDESAACRLCVSRSMLLYARQDWPAAVSLWSEFRSRYPDNEIGRNQMGRAIHNRAFATLDSRHGGSDVVPVEAEKAAVIEVVEDAPTKRLLLRFDSLGATCEFGLVQRRYGAEPLSLLRWNNVAIDKLVAALATRMEGIGETANTEIFTAGNGEFFVRDRRWGFEMHTWLFAGQVDPDLLYAQMCRRVAFLKDKFLADLKDGEKIFVFTSLDLEMQSLATLHDALKAYGPVRLLAVQPAAMPFAGQVGTAGTIRAITSDRYVGFVERLGLRSDGMWDIDFDSWTSICRHLVDA